MVMATEHTANLCVWLVPNLADLVGQAFDRQLSSVFDHLLRRVPAAQFWQRLQYQNVEEGTPR